MYDQREQLAQEIAPTRHNRDAAPPSPNSPTNSRFLELREKQNATLELVSKLEEGLNNVLSPPAPENTKDGAAPMAPSPLCDELDQRIGTQAFIANRIASLIQRLTL